VLTEIIAPAGVAVSVHLLIGDEVVRRGVEALVHAVPSVEEVTVHHGTPEAGRALAEPGQQPAGEACGPRLRVLITTPDDADNWHGLRALVELIAAQYVETPVAMITDRAFSAPPPASFTSIKSPGMSASARCMFITSTS